MNIVFFSGSVQLLMPHFRYTLHINTGGRKTLFGPEGALNEVQSSTSLIINILIGMHFIPNDTTGMFFCSTFLSAYKNNALCLYQSSLGYDGIVDLMRRGLADIRYSSFFPPEDIAARGLETISNNFYRDDGLKLWNIINGLTLN